MTNKSIEKCKAQIKRHEGLRLNAYEDTLGFWTIGYGHLLGEKPVVSKITQEEADTLFEADFKTAYKDAEKLVWTFGAMSDERQAVIVNMAFNMGFATLKKFAKMIRALEERDYAKAAGEMLASKWAKQVGKRAIELAAQMRTGEWQ